MNLLFICSRNRKRSPTAEALFSGRDGMTAISAGIDGDSPTPLTGDLIEWADAILVMEERHRRHVRSRFGRAINGRSLLVLGIPDRFEFMDDELVELLEQRVPRLLRRIA